MGRTVRDGKCTCVIEYHPLPSQGLFHASKRRFKGFSGPIGSGKSQALCQEAVKLSYLNPGRQGLLGAPTYPMLRDATQTALLQILYENGIPYALNRSENILVMKETGSRILLRSLDEFERLRGTNLAWFGIDELTYTHEEAWLRLEGRLRDPKATRLCGFAVWTPKGADWVCKRFLESPVEGYEAIIAKSMENHYILDKIPDFHERLKHSYDEKFYRQEVLGEYLNINEGRVYHEYLPDLHLRDVKVDGGKPLLWSLDFNVDPMSSIVAQIHDGVVSILDEIVLNRASTMDACEEFLNRFGQHPMGIRIYGDSSGNSMQTAGGTDYGIVRTFFSRRNLRKVSFHVLKRNPPVRDRVALVDRLLKSAAGDVRMFVNPRCNELVKDFQEVSYKPDSGVIDKDRDRSRTHLSDALGYLVWMELQQRSCAGERQTRLF